MLDFSRKEDQPSTGLYIWIKTDVGWYTVCELEESDINLLDMHNPGLKQDIKEIQRDAAVKLAQEIADQTKERETRFQKTPLLPKAGFIYINISG